VGGNGARAGRCGPRRRLRPGHRARRIAEQGGGALRAVAIANAMRRLE
jgi:hypothetical protein